MHVVGCFISVGPHRTTAGVPLCGPSIKPQVHHSFSLSIPGEVALDFVPGKRASRIFRIWVKATIRRAANDIFAKFTPEMGIGEYPNLDLCI